MSRDKFIRYLYCKYLLR